MTGMKLNQIERSIHSGGLLLEDVQLLIEELRKTWRENRELREMLWREEEK